MGVAKTAPYDRIIATAAVSNIPPAWVEQTRPGGIILTDLRGDIAGGMVKLSKIDDCTAQGRFLDYPGLFMWLRPRADHPLRAHETPFLAVDKRNARHRHTGLDPRVLDDDAFVFIAQLHAPQVKLSPPSGPGDGFLLVSSGRDYSWAEIATSSDVGGYPVSHGGPRDLWGLIEQAHDLWLETGKPTAERFGVTATADRRFIWLDEPITGTTWDLPL